MHTSHIAAGRSRLLPTTFAPVDLGGKPLISILGVACIQPLQAARDGSLQVAKEDTGEKLHNPAWWGRPKEVQAEHRLSVSVIRVESLGRGRVWADMESFD